MRIVLQGIDALDQHPKVVFGSLAVAAMVGCSNNSTLAPEQIPDVPVFVQINLNNPQYQLLVLPGTHLYIENAGYRGILIWHDWDGSYRAFDRACSYHPHAKCALIHMDSSDAFMKCGHYEQAQWMPCCASRFDLTGWPTQGPATLPLRQYTVHFERSLLIIQN